MSWVNSGVSPQVMMLLRGMLTAVGLASLSETSKDKATHLEMIRSMQR